MSNTNTSGASLGLICLLASTLFTVFMLWIFMDKDAESVITNLREADLRCKSFDGLRSYDMVSVTCNNGFVISK
jgi:hypothetical protein